MIEAHFDSKMGRTALITGAYQYDTGQRLRLSGLPSPSELAEMDDFLSGDVVTVMVHFSRRGDSQSDSRLAQWNEERGIWLVSVPDEYLTRHIAVCVQVFVYYGTDGEDERGKTMYEGAFIPISRAAPSNVVTDDQREAWAAKEQEVQLVLKPLADSITGAQSAAEEALLAADAADRAAKEAKEKAEETEAILKELVETFSGMSVSVKALPMDSEATASLDDGRITLGVPDGEAGEKGAAGDDGPTDVSFSYDASTKTLTITTK